MKTISYKHLVLLSLLSFTFSWVNTIYAKTFLDSVKVQLIYQHQFQFAGYYTAIEKGFYEDVGLDVSLLLPLYGVGSTERVISGDANFGIGSHGLVKKRVEGLPIVLLASIFQHSPQALITSDKSGINNIKDLAKKRVMIEKHAIDLLAFMEDEGITEDMLYKIPYDYDVSKLIEGKVDAMSVYLTDNTYILDSLKHPYKIISPLSGGIDFYGDSIFTTEEYYTNNKEKVNKFVEATIKGFYYAFDNKEEVIDLIINKYNSKLSRNHLRYEANKMEEFIARDIVKIGHINEGRWRYTLNVYEKLNLIDKGSSLNGFFISDYEKDFIDKFSKQTIIILLVVFVLVVIFALVYLFIALKLKKQLQKSLQLEEYLKDSNSTKDRLISIIAHDLKNPFSGIISLSSLVLMDVENIDKAELKNSLRLIRNSAEDAYQMLKNLLEWVVIQQDGIKARQRSVKVYEEYLHIFDLYKEQASKKNITISLSINATHTAYTDPHMLEVVIRNLITNAIKFTNFGGHISVETRVHKDLNTAEDKISLSVKDNGIGMTEQSIDEIMTSTVFKSNPGTEKEKGTGLGLVIIKEFIAANEGILSVQSSIGKGSTFSLILPAKE